MNAFIVVIFRWRCHEIQKDKNYVIKPCCQYYANKHNIAKFAVIDHVNNLRKKKSADDDMSDLNDNCCPVIEK